MKAKRARRRLIVIIALTIITVLVGEILAIAGNSATSSNLYPGPLKYLAKYAWEIAGIATLVIIVLTIAKLIIDKQSDQIDGTFEQLDQKAQALASAVRAQWSDEAEKRSLWRPGPLRVRWASTGRPVVGPSITPGRRGFPNQRLQLHGNAANIVEVFRQLKPRQLAVLGDPGAGKTVMAILLLLGLLNEPEPGEPVPVLASLGSWNPRIDHFDAWLARRIVEDYPLTNNILDHNTARRLVAEHRVMPILDGLDEMSPELHSEAIDAIDRSVVGECPLVVTCRGDEYERAVIESGAFLHRTMVVEVQPVEVSDAIDFLKSTRLVSDQRWRPVFEHLRENPRGAIARAFSTPLMIDLARTAYGHPSTNPVELLDFGRFGTQSAIEKHLFNALIPTVYAGRPERPLSARHGQYAAKKAKRWLMFLARYLHQHNTPDLFWWHVNSGVLNILVPCAIFGAGAWTIFVLIFGPALGSIGGFAMAGLAGMNAYYGWSTAEALSTHQHISGDPQAVLRRLQLNSMGWTLSAGFIVGLSIGLWLGLALGVSTSRAALFGIIFAAMLGLGGAASTVWGDYLIACVRFGLARCLPLRLISFLDDARTRGVLRQTGTAYQFRHARFQEYLINCIPSLTRVHSIKHRKRRNTLNRSKRRSLTAVLVMRLAPHVIGFIVIFVLLSAFAITGTIKYSSGYHPEITYFTPICGGPGACPPPQIETISWLLPPAGKEVTAFDWQLDSSLPYDRLVLRFKVDKCAGASIAIIVVSGHRVFLSQLFSQSHPRGTSWSYTVLFPRAVSRFFMSFQRVDSEECTVQLTWKTPELTNDFWSNLGQSFRHSNS